MMTGIQKIILTCLLGSEDTKAFKREKARLKQELRRATSLTCQKYEKEAARKRWADPVEREKALAYRLTNAVALKEYSKEYDKKRRTDPEVQAKERAYALTHKEAGRAAARKSNRKRWADPTKREKMKAANKKWASKHPEKSRKSQQRARAKQFKRDPASKLAHTLRARMRAALKRGSKFFPSRQLLGCTTEQWKNHLENLFKPGMTWGNHGSVWHIDHIKPCAKFNLTDPEQQKACFNWTNTQPLFAAENIAKGDKCS